MRLAASRALWTAGMSRPTRMAMTAITTKSSISVKPLRGMYPGERLVMVHLAFLGPHLALGGRGSNDHGPGDAKAAGPRPAPGRPPKLQLERVNVWRGRLKNQQALPLPGPPPPSPRRRV